MRGAGKEKSHHASFSSAFGGVAARSRVLSWLALLAVIRDLARRL